MTKQIIDNIQSYLRKIERDNDPEARNELCLLCFFIMDSTERKWLATVYNCDERVTGGPFNKDRPYIKLYDLSSREWSGTGIEYLVTGDRVTCLSHWKMSEDDIKRDYHEYVIKRHQRQI